MHDKQFVKIALICSIIGVVLLYFISLNYEINELEINKINDNDIEKTSKITGEVVKVLNKDSLTIITIKKPETIKVVLFENISLNRTDTVEIIGKVEKYKGEYEIIADKIKVYNE